ncbi:TetR/AcrR family transcriptional regulator [Neobacillus pocheonensis]|uniref:TetR/AcrR family transcriptional regulator n=1 Tax=Neobacillus pocheonensis TaxID=363869 RepID=A0ABT0W9E1_9BACI|nr:TetR/AcrR family transcriptional regulator [Neobacillus pocheonensis]
MNQIATEAQIGPGSLYRRYKNKGDLCLGLIKDNVVLLFDDMDAYLEKNLNESSTVRFNTVSTYLSDSEKIRHNCLEVLMTLHPPIVGDPSQ